MTTAGTVSVHSQTYATSVLTFRWRLILAAGLLIVSVVVAAALGCVTMDSVEEVRGAYEWMSSPWGWSFGVPVLWPVAGLAGVGAIAACLAAYGRGGRRAWGTLLVSTVALLGLGVWYFVGLGLMNNREFLRGPYYVLALSGGSLAAVVLMSSLPTRRFLARMNAPCAAGGVTLPGAFIWRSVTGGLALMGIILAGSALGTPPQDARELALRRTLNIKQMAREGDTRVLLTTGGRAILRLNKVPVLGSPDAPHVIYHFFDYTDPMSQASYAALRNARKRYGDQIVVLTLVWPLDAALNPQVPAEVAAQHPGAGEYARLALAVWRANPARFEAFHDYLLTPPANDLRGLMSMRTSMPSVQEARATAAAMVGAEALERAMADPWIDQEIRLHLDARKPDPGPEPGDKFAPVMSWLRLRETDGAYEGRGALGPISSAVLFESMEEFLGIKPVHTELDRDDPVLELLN